MSYTFILRHDVDFTQAVRPDVLRHCIEELDHLHRAAGEAPAWEVWTGPAQGRVRVRFGERGFPLDEDDDEYVDSVLVILSNEGLVDPDVRDTAWTLLKHLAARLKWEMFDGVVGRVLGPDERVRFENSALEWFVGTRAPLAREDRSAGPGTPKIGG